MKVSVLGAGAIGTMFGGLIQHHDPSLDVVLIARGDHGNALRRQGGVVLEGPWGRRDVSLRVSSDVAELDGSQYVLLTVKSQATCDAIQSARPFLNGATVVSIQNGINEPRLVPHVDPERLVMAVTATNMAVLEPGRVSLQLGGTTLAGPRADGSNAQAVDGAVDLLRRSGLPVRSHPDIDGVRYNKLAINAIGYASCLSASNFISEALADRRWRRCVGRPILEECLETFRHAGIQPRRIAGTPSLTALRRVLGGFDLPVLGSVLESGARRIYEKKPILFSLYQDLKRGKATEVDHINGEIVRLAQRHGIAAPWNDQVTRMVHELERAESPAFYTHEQVVERFQGLPQG